MSRERRTQVIVIHCGKGALHNMLELMGECWEHTQLGGMPRALEGYIADMCQMVGQRERLQRNYGVKS